MQIPWAHQLETQSQECVQSHPSAFSPFFVQLLPGSGALAPHGMSSSARRKPEAMAVLQEDAVGG